MEDFNPQNGLQLSSEFIRKLIPFGWIIFIVHGLYAIFRVYNKFKYADIFDGPGEWYSTLDWVFVAGSFLGVGLGVRVLLAADKALKNEDSLSAEETRKAFLGYLTFTAIFAAVQFLFNMFSNFLY